MASHAAAPINASIATICVADSMAGIAARLERPAPTACQRGIFLVIALARFVDGMDLGALTFVFGKITPGRDELNAGGPSARALGWEL